MAIEALLEILRACKMEIIIEEYHNESKKKKLILLDRSSMKRLRCQESNERIVFSTINVLFSLFPLEKLPISEHGNSLCL